MGNFYSNLTLKGPDRDAVVEALRALGRTALVAPGRNGCTVVYDQDTLEPDNLQTAASALSERLNAPAFAVVVFDDDVLLYFLAENGRITDQYNSCPGCFGEDLEITEAGITPSGGDAERLCRAFEVPEAIEEIRSVLRSPGPAAIGAGAADESAVFQFTFEFERHDILAQRLGLPEWAVGLGYEYIEAGEWPGVSGLGQDELKRVG